MSILEYQHPTESMGQHYIVELSGCNPQKLSHVKTVEDIFLDAAERSKATLLNHFFHQFSPQGVSGVLLIAESHFSIHTWPERAYAAIDIFTCGDTMKPEVACDIMKEQFEATEMVSYRVERGYSPDNQ